MDRNVLNGICRSLIGPGEIPDRIVDHAESLVLQSGTKLPLKPMEEPARRHICCFLAVEQAAAKLGIGEPEFEKTPLPPPAFAKLVDEFRAVLIKKRKERDDSPAMSPEKETPRRKPPQRSTTSSARVSKAGARKFAGSIDSPRLKPQNVPPTAAQIAKIGEKLELKDKTMNAINHAFALYQGLVKDDWGLMVALIYVLAERAEPQPDLRTKVLKAVTSTGIPAATQRLEEWEPWARRVATGQTWVAEISVVPEPLPELFGSAGGWGTKTPQLIPFASDN